MAICTLQKVAVQWRRRKFLPPLSQQQSLNPPKHEIATPISSREAHGVQLGSLVHATLAKLGAILLTLSLRSPSGTEHLMPHNAAVISTG